MTLLRSAFLLVFLTAAVSTVMRISSAPPSAEDEIRALYAAGDRTADGDWPGVRLSFMDDAARVEIGGVRTSRKALLLSTAPRQRKQLRTQVEFVFVSDKHATVHTRTDVIVLDRDDDGDHEFIETLEADEQLARDNDGWKLTSSRMRWISGFWLDKKHYGTDPEQDVQGRG